MKQTHYKDWQQNLTHKNKQTNKQTTTTSRNFCTKIIFLALSKVTLVSKITLVDKVKYQLQCISAGINHIAQCSFAQNQWNLSWKHPECFLKFLSNIWVGQEKANKQLFFCLTLFKAFSSQLLQSRSSLIYFLLSKVDSLGQVSTLLILCT